MEIMRCFKQAYRNNLFDVYYGNFSVPKMRDTTFFQLQGYRIEPLFLVSTVI
jgi:hypothetical protein